MANERKAIGLLLKNNPGALSRISGLFCRRNFNIDSITSSATTDPAVTRVTITIHDDETVLRQLMLQTARSMLEEGKRPVPDAGKASC